MNREILYRIKNGDGKWVYGFPIVYDDGSFEFIDQEPLNNLELFDMCTIQSAYNDTLSEFTGLEDINGTRIFEGDIVKDKCWNNDHTLFAVKYTDDQVASCGCCAPKFDGIGFVGEAKGEYCGNVYRCRLSNCEVVGNIWDNPKLLEGNNESKGN